MTGLKGVDPAYMTSWWS